MNEGAVSDYTITHRQPGMLYLIPENEPINVAHFMAELTTDTSFMEHLAMPMPVVYNATA